MPSIVLQDLKSVTAVQQSVVDLGAVLPSGTESQQLADTADIAGVIAGDPVATEQYVNSLLQVLELIDEAGPFVDLLPLW